MKIMKTFILIVAVLGALASIAGCIIGLTATDVFAANNGRVRGSGHIVTKTIDAPAFNAIDASRAVKVVISDQLTDKITIEADDNLIAFVSVKVDEGTLVVSLDKSFKGNLTYSNMIVTVPANGKIRSLEASSAARITSAVTLSAPEFSIDASSAARINAKVMASKCEIETSSAARVEAALTATTCEIDLSSASRCTLTGSATNCHAELGSSSKLNASEFIVSNYDIEAGSASNASINCTERLVAKASSAASINYTGNCTTTGITKSSAGSVTKN